MFGWGYAINHLVTLFQKEQKQKVFEIYIAKNLRLINENIAKLVTIEGRGKVEASFIKLEYEDLLESKQPKEVKTKEQVIDDIEAEFLKLGFEVKKPEDKEGD